MPFLFRYNNTGQPDLDGRSCATCDGVARYNLRARGPGIYGAEIRLCEPCRKELAATVSQLPMRGPMRGPEEEEK